MARRNERLYHIYYGIKARCYNSKNPKYHLYGGKGIKMCEEWQDYENFKSWSLKNGWNENLPLNKWSIDRKDSDDDYKPSNCQWITIGENSAKANINTHKNKSKKGKMFARNLITNKVEEILNVSKFARDNKLNRCLVSHRLNNTIKDKVLENWEIYRE